MNPFEDRDMECVDKTHPGLRRFALSSWAGFRKAMGWTGVFTTKKSAFVAGYCAGVVEGERLRRRGAI